MTSLSRLQGLVKAQAVRLFTDRENAREAFWYNASSVLSGFIRFRVLTYYGVGGIGKTALLKEIRSDLDSHHHELAATPTIIVIDLDSTQITSAADALFAFRRQWNGKCPLFEYALAKYWALQGRTIDDIRKQRLPEDSLLFDITEAAGDLADIFTPARLVRKLISHSADFLQRHGKLASKFEEIDAFSEDELVIRLPVFLGEEVSRWYQKNDQRLMVFVDAHERLTTDSRFRLGKLGGDEWLRELVAISGVGLWIIAGRNYIRWAEENAEWDEFLEQHSLGALSDGDAEGFLRSIPIHEPTIRLQIIASSRGVPLYLDLCASIYVLRKESGQTVAPENFDSADRDVVRRFLDQLDREESAAVCCLSALSAFDKPLFAGILKELNIALPVLSFADFCKGSYAEPISLEDGTYKIHDVIRGHLSDEIEVDDQLSILNTILAQARQSLSGGGYHRTRWLLRTATELTVVLTRRYPPLSREIVDEELDIALNLIDAGFADEILAYKDRFMETGNAAVSAAGMFLEAHALRRRGRLQDALAAYVSLTRTVAALPSHGLRVAYHHAHVRHLLGDYGGAFDAYTRISAEKAKNRFEQQASNMALRQVGDIHLLHGRFTIALDLFQKCLNLNPSDWLWHAETARFVGHCYRFNFLFRMAEEMYIRIAKEAASTRAHGMYGKALTNLAETRCWYDYQQALSDADQAIKVNDEVGNLLEVGKAYAARAIACCFDGNHSDGIRSAEKALAIQKDIGYRAGEAFALAALCLIHAASGEKGESETNIVKLEQLTAGLGVYRFIGSLVRAITTEISTDLRRSNFEWISIADTEKEIERIKLTLLS